ncbi:hypothetical protein K8P10_002994 [Leucobacter sp. Psy1]|nr:hypothetical protein K8P10_002994 [Leucobacter sp. Psy1]
MRFNHRRVIHAKAHEINPICGYAGVLRRGNLHLISASSDRSGESDERFYVTS